MKKYDWPNNVTDEDIKRAFESNSITFLARRFNPVRWALVAFENAHNLYIDYTELSFKDVMSVNGITPDMLRHIFDGRNLTSSEIEDEDEDDYDRLGGFPRTDMKAWKELAKVLKKSVKVVTKDGGKGEYYYLFTIDSSGEIVDKAK